MLLSLITLCGLLMIFITASDPRVVAKIQYSAEYVSTGFDNPDQIGSARPVLLLGLEKGEERTSRNSSAQSSMAFRAKRKASGFMPGDNVPVRRGGILN